ncbi:MAG: hypothetical protein Q9198_001634 [Flavoplaca austrocitrina]
MELIKNTQLPEEPQYPGVEPFYGIDLEVLKSLRENWLNTFDWEKEQASLNSFEHFTATIEGLTIHFVHKTSNDPDAIPLLLTHGWPGSFLEFLPVIDPLTSTEKPVSFHVVVPSLPGVAFSTSPPGNWTLADSARVFNTLMTEVLGYKTFSVHGTSIGGFLTYTLYDQFNTTVRAIHCPVVPFYCTTSEEIAAREITLSPLEQFEHERAMDWTYNGTSYVFMHIYKVGKLTPLRRKKSLPHAQPNTLGLSLYDSPVGQLAWMAEKWIDYPELPFKEGIYRKARTDAPMLVSLFKYTVGFWPEDVLRMMGNLERYRVETARKRSLDEEDPATQPVAKRLEDDAEAEKAVLPLCAIFGHSGTNRAWEYFRMVPRSSGIAESQAAQGIVSEALTPLGGRGAPLEQSGG